MTTTKPMVLFSRAGGGHNYHIRLVRHEAQGHVQIVRRALCGYAPHASRYMTEKGHWVSSQTIPPRWQALCPRCATKAGMAKEAPESTAQVIWGETVQALLKKGPQA